MMISEIKDIKKVLILGSGTLGLRIGLQSAISGFDTVIFDISSSAFDAAEKVHDKILHHQLKKGLLREDDLSSIKKRITWTSDPKLAIENIDFVSESVTEDLDIKKKVWSEFGPKVPSRAILTTNTSYLRSSQFADETGSPERFCAFHFHDVFWANVVDIMPHPHTASSIVPLLKDMGYRLKQTPVVIQKENPGYLFNSMLMAILGAAGALVTFDIASIEDVDRSWMGNFKMPSGPFGILDEIGLDTAWHVTRVRNDEKSKRFASLLKTYVDQGKLGVKTGEGFYKYPDPKFKEPDFLQ